VYDTSTQRIRSCENEGGAGNLTSDFRSIVSLALSVLCIFGWRSTERGEVDEKYNMFENLELKRKFGPKWE